MIVSEERSLSLLFKSDITEAEQERLADTLTPYKDLVTIKSDSQTLTLQYEFPDITFTALWHSLLEIHPRIRSMNRLCCNLKSMMEANEKESLQYPQHWQGYVEDVHMHYFDNRHSDIDASHKHLWRRYQKKSGLQDSAR